MADIQYWDDTLTEEIETIRHLLDQISSLTTAEEKGALLSKIDKRLRGAAGTKRSFKMETRLVSDVNMRRKYEGRLSRLDQEIQTLTADCKALKAEQERGELMARGGDEGVEISPADAQKAGDNMLAEAAELQNKTQDSLSNTKNMIAASKEVGLSTLEELERQREVINNIEKETQRIDDNLQRAEALVKQFSKRIASDRFIQCFAVVNCCLLTGVVLYAIIKRGGLNLPGDSEPPSPVRRLFLRGLMMSEDEE